MIFPFFAILVLIFIIVILFETQNYPIISKTDPSLRIAIVMVFSKNTNLKNYEIALQTIKCYCKIHNYTFVQLLDTDFNCPHKDKFFRRHCTVAKVLPSYDAVLFLDADIGVVNPKRKIEEFLEEGVDVTFVNRFYNWEISAGFYLARNTQYAVDLLNGFANYEFKLPFSFHGTDNGALHMYLAEHLFPDASAESNICKKAYSESKSYRDLFTFEACIKSLFGVGTRFGKVRIMKKVVYLFIFCFKNTQFRGTGWARDGWLTSMMWHPDLDFMIHGWKTNQLRKTPNMTMRPVQMGRSQWYNPLAGPTDLEKCGPHNSTWSYDPRMLGNKDRIVDSLRAFEQKIALAQVRSYSRLEWLLSH
ncbi:Nucleotide-diphospho-sugar transferase domain-containing protein [Caenorhabditis elegans]|uniref:Nucleotide-diphospho-sugar transferase domain-containing protein n=1 Tax=Caenorhabditis elegans TaxID=6239 RepID=O45841_CAEEL|nr:Nucleotide-diphospho-sugar transferase domain-containing protein [Caenorhabditis elegans]CAB03436.3 Nucleotide-diphospho-sugar transferase domain-containing protein [Caenorhabditis elegans]|eukprot:NP_506937.3 Uncharacterized protein CELE_T26E4.7 [Caenorhabditis elegans]